MTRPLLITSPFKDCLFLIRLRYTWFPSWQDFFSMHSNCPRFLIGNAQEFFHFTALNHTTGFHILSSPYRLAQLSNLFRSYIQPVAFYTLLWFSRHRYLLTAQVSLSFIQPKACFCSLFPLMSKVCLLLWRSFVRTFSTIA